MAIRESGARYSFGLSRTLLRALNDDLTRPEVTNVIGGAGPFDFTSFSSDYTKIPMTLKVGSAVAQSLEFDLTAAVSKSAVTVDELVTSITAALTAESITGWTFSKDATTGRIKAVNTTTGAYVQVYGAGARIMRIGQGKGIKAIKSNTLQTLTATPRLKEDTEHAITDANDKDTEVIKEGYTKGFDGSIVDTAEDFEIMELAESGTLSADGKTYTAPVSSTKKVMFEIETWNPLYAYGTNAEDQIVGWEHKTFRAVKGALGENTKQAGFGTYTYTLKGVAYKTSAGIEEGCIKTEVLDYEDWSPAIFDSTY